MHRIGVLPFDVTDDAIAMLFITSKTRGRWIPPKGRAKKNESHEDVCHREAFEEAGIRGIVLNDFPITVVISRSTDNGVEKIPVTYYPFLVLSQVDSWPEQTERVRHWVLAGQAAKIVDRKDFLDLVKQFDELSPWIKTVALAHKSAQQAELKPAQ